MLYKPIRLVDFCKHLTTKGQSRRRNKINYSNILLRFNGIEI